MPRGIPWDDLPSALPEALSQSSRRPTHDSSHHNDVKPIEEGSRAEQKEKLISMRGMEAVCRRVAFGVLVSGKITD